jgi:hypothetical protein
LCCEPCSAERAILANISLTSLSLGTAGNAGDRSLRVDSLDSGRCDSAGHKAAGTTANSDRAGLNLGRQDSDGCGTTRPRVGTKTKSRVQAGIYIGALDGAVVGANASRDLEGGTNAKARGRADINTIGGSGRKAHGLALAVVSDLESATNNAVIAVDSEVSFECIADDGTVELEADQRFGTSRGRSAGRTDDSRGAGRNAIGTENS